MRMNLIDEEAFGQVCAELGRSREQRNPRSANWRTRRFEAARVAEKLPPKGTLLDIGCGAGFIPRYFHRLGFRVISTDFADTGGVQALTALIERGIEGHFLNVGADPLPVPDNSVDVVFAGNVVEHLPNSPRRFVADLKRVLKPGGFLVMDTKNAVDLKTRLKVLAGVSNWAPLARFYDLEINPHHHKEYTLKELGQLLNLAGFEQIELYAFETFFQQSLRKFRTIHALGATPGEANEFGSSFNPWHPYEYARLGLLALACLFPGLRTDIMAIGRKRKGDEGPA
jgi:SAM-dependent methyltransferase